MKIVALEFSGVPTHDNAALDYPTAWAIQREVGASLAHHLRCSSVPGWSPISGPGVLCDCGAVEREWQRRKDGAADDDGGIDPPAGSGASR